MHFLWKYISENSGWWVTHFYCASNYRKVNLRIWISQLHDFLGISLIDYHWWTMVNLLSSLTWPCFSLTLLWRRSLSYRNNSIDLQCKSIMEWFLYDKHIRQEELTFLLNYLVQRTSSCKLPWHLWHCVQSLLNFSSKACRVLISFWNNSLSLGLQCWQTTEFSGMKNNNVLGITNCLVRETDNINSLNLSKLPSYRNK